MAYIGQSQSVRAEQAKLNGEWPISHCQRIIKKETGITLTTDFLKAKYEPSSWHHTGKEFAKTDFYFTHQMINDILKNDLIQEYIDFSERNEITVNSKQLKKKESDFLAKEIEGENFFFIHNDGVEYGDLKGLTLTTIEGQKIEIEPSDQKDLITPIVLYRHIGKFLEGWNLNEFEDIKYQLPTAEPEDRVAFLSIFKKAPDSVREILNDFKDKYSESEDEPKQRNKLKI